MSDEYKVGVRLQADASQYTAEFTRAAGVQQAFNAQVAGGAASADAALNTVAQSAKSAGNASQTALQTTSQASGQASAALDSVAASLTGVSTAARGVGVAAEQATNLGGAASLTAGKLDTVTQSATRMGAASQAALQGMTATSGQASKSLDGVASAWYGVNAAASKPQNLGDVMQTWTRSGTTAASAIDNASGKTKELGVSAAQTAAAMRQVPAQFTDIVVSLQAGQSPMTVMLQQGGQLKDMFGGMGAAAKALGSYVMGLVNPFTVAAAAVAVLGLAYYQGSSESDKFRASIVMSGNAAGATTAQLVDMSKAVSGNIGTQSAAASVLAEMAGSGKVAATNLQYFTEVAMGLDKYVGVPIKTTIDAFEELGKKPVEASLKLNEQYNYLTEAVYRQIKALQDQGKTEEAAALAQRTYADAMAERTGELKAHLGSVERAWLSITGVAKKAWDAMLGIGRGASLSDLRTQITQAEEKLNDLLTSDGFSTTAGGAAIGGGANSRAAAIAQVRRALAELNAQAAPLEAADATERIKGEQRAEEDEKLAARQRVDRLKKEVRTKAEIRADEIAQLDRDRVKLAMGQAEYDKLLTGINERHKDPKTPKRSGGISVSDSELANMQGQLSAAREYGRQLIELGPAALQLNSAERESLKIGEELKRTTDAKTRARLLEKQQAADALGVQLRTNDGLKESIQNHQKLIDTTEADAVAIEQRAREQEAANEALGKGKTAIQAMTLAELEKQMAEAQGSDSFDPKYIASLERKIDAQKRYVSALTASDGKSLAAHADELLRNADEMVSVYKDELNTIGMTREQRELIVAARQLEIKYAKELAKIDESSATDAEKQAARDKTNAAKQRELSATTAKIVETQFFNASQEINRSLTDALMRGFEDGKTFGENLCDTLKNMFNTLVLRPIVSAIVQPVSMVINGVVQTGLEAVGLGGSGSSGIIGTASNLSSLYSTGSRIMGLFGGGSAAAGAAASGLGFTATSAGASAIGAGIGSSLGAGMGAAASTVGGVGMTVGGGTLGMTATSAGASAIGAGLGTGAATAGTAAAGTAAAGTGGLMSALSAIPVWGWIAAAVVAAIGFIVGNDDSGTPHVGSVGSYSEEDGYNQVQDGTELGIDMGMYYGGTEMAKIPETVSKGIVGVLDGLASTFDKDKGYKVVTGFADDGSKDGAWGGLRIIGADGKDLVNWDDTRTSKWAPRTFANGEDGLKEYLSAVAVDTRKIMMESLDLPTWAKDIVKSVDEENFDLDSLQALVTQIGEIQASFDNLGKSIKVFGELSSEAQGAIMQAAGGLENLNQIASSYYNNFYSTEERTTTQRSIINEQLKALGLDEIDLGADDAREKFRALVEAQIALGEESAKTVAALLGLSEAVAAVTTASEDATQAAARAAEAAAKEADAAKAKLRAATDAAWSALQRSVSAAREAAQAEAQLRQERVDAARAVLDVSREQIRELRGLVDDTAGMAAKDGMAYIDRALTTVMRTGYLPDSTELSDAITAARSGMGTDAFRNRLDYEAAQLILANKLEVIGDASDDQLTNDELLLEQARAEVDRLDQLLAAEQQALNAARGIDTSVKDVGVAVREFRAALLKETEGGAADGSTSSGGSSAGPVVGPSGGSTSSGTRSKYYKTVETGTGSFEMGVTDEATISRLDGLKAFWDSAPANGYTDITDVYKDLAKAGYSTNEIAAATGLGYQDLKDSIARHGVPAFADGGNHLGGLRLVGEEGPELEITGPSRIFNKRQIADMLGGNGDMAQLLKAIQRLEDQGYTIGRRVIELLMSIDSVTRKNDRVGVKQRETAAA